VRPISRTNPSTCRKIKYSSRSDTRGSCPTADYRWSATQARVLAPHRCDLQPLVDVIDEHGIDLILATLDQLSPETDTDTTVSTIHKAKGREWSTVRIANDFPEPEDPTTPTSTACHYPPLSTPPRPAWPTSPSPAPNTTSTSAASAGSTATPTETPPQPETHHPNRPKAFNPRPIARTMPGS